MRLLLLLHSIFLL
ncbi:hypothetical protein Zm00014a_022057 [Zea mays]|uniref:Uncharacterized protein n=1 Tax=Zea mays TaxID=4577 RepID=A0A3L6EP63_MAIZE|nr:hypothetical protein Zm00014a_022057 [Zea mays]